MHRSPMRAGDGDVSLNARVDYDHVRNCFDVAVIERGLTHVRSERCSVVDDPCAALDDLAWRLARSFRDYDGELELLADADDATAYLIVGPRENDATISVAARTPARADAALAQVVERLRRPGSGDPERVAMRLWTGGTGGGSPTFTRRVLDAPGVAEAAVNYPAVVRERFEDMCGVEQGAVGGLALWYGPPGTGKTTAVRALARAWRSWCDVHVVVDPEALLADPGYLMKVVTERSFEDEDLPAGAVRAAKRSRLVVLEDAGELLAADARAATGQGLSRILNVTDGLVGRGLGTSILITTNEELGSLHPAIRRPGRCWAQVRFGRFSGPEARAWLEERELDAGDVTGSRSLAELFALQRGEAIAEPDRPPLGFLA